MTINPEFRRNLWLDLTPHRLIGMPVMVGAVSLLIYLSSGNDREPLSMMSLIAFGALTFLWGARSASESIVTEINDRTWDGQRMSVIGPWAMTWGKLLGSTAYTWYGGAWCLAVFIFTLDVTLLADPLRTLALLILCALLCQGLGLASSLMAIRKTRTIRSSQSTGFAVLALIIVSSIIPLAYNGPALIEWYSFDLARFDFVIMTTAALLAWALFGAYRLMRLELQIKGTPVAWLSFVIFLIVYAAGFFDYSDILLGESSGYADLAPQIAALAFFIALSSTYLMLFIENKDPIQFRTIFRSVEDGAYDRVLTSLPGWTATVPLMALAAVAYTATTFIWSPPEGPPAAFIGAVTFFFVRDAAILLFVNLASNNKRADLAAVVYFILLYAVVPPILYAMKLETVTALFWPFVDERAYLSLGAAIFESLVVMWFLYMRWEKNYGLRRGSST